MRAHDIAIQSFLARELRPGETIIGAAFIRNETPTPALLAVYGNMPPPLVAYLVPTNERLFVIRTALQPFSSNPRPECNGIEHVFAYPDIERIATRGGFGGVEFDVYLRGVAAPHGFVVWDQCKELRKHEAIARGFVSWFTEQQQEGWKPREEAPLAEPFAPASSAMPEAVADDVARVQGRNTALVGLGVVLAVAGVAVGGVFAILHLTAPRPAPTPVVGPSSEPPRSPQPPPGPGAADAGGPQPPRGGDAGPPGPVPPQPRADGGAVDEPPPPPEPPRPGPPPTLEPPTPAGLAALNERSASARLTGSGFTLASATRDKYLGIGTTLDLELHDEGHSDYGRGTLFDFGLAEGDTAVEIGAGRVIAVNGGTRAENERVVRAIASGGCKDNTSCVAALQRLGPQHVQPDDSTNDYVFGYRTFLLFAQIGDVQFAVYVVDYAPASRGSRTEAVVVEGKLVLIVELHEGTGAPATRVARMLAGRPLTDD